MEKGWYERAEMEFLETLRIRPSEIRARQNLGVLYWKMGRNQQAKAELLDAYQADTSNTSVIKNLAVMYRFYLKQPDSAMLWANRYLNLEPKGDFDAYSIREEFDKMQKRYPELTPDEPLKWKKEPKFKARNSGK
jgi:tetratricopeptide (TPR) repeat protein